MMSDELRPCPFCGGSASMLNVSDVYPMKKKIDMWRVHCRVCYAESNAFRSRAEAVDAWNRRAAGKGGG